MKKFYFLIAIILFTKTISAQQYFPLLDSVNHWQSQTNYIPVRIQQQILSNTPCTYPIFYSAILEHFTAQDTVINSLTYKVVGAAPDFNPTSCDFGYVREDTTNRKVFFKDNLGNPEILLYNFSMQVNDTMTINFPPFGYFTSGVYTLDSIRTIHINSGFRRIFYLNNHSVSWGPVLPWIESVGCPLNPFYPYFMNGYSSNQYFNCNVFIHDANEFLTCFDHLAKVYYDSCAYHFAVQNSCFQIDDTCNYHNICGSVEEIFSFASMNIYPNASSGPTTISIDVKHSNQFELLFWDISGKKIFKEIQLGTITTGKKEIELDLSTFSNGIYLVELKTAEGSIFQRLSIQH